MSISVSQSGVSSSISGMIGLGGGAAVSGRVSGVSQPVKPVGASGAAVSSSKLRSSIALNQSRASSSTGSIGSLLATAVGMVTRGGGGSGGSTAATGSFSQSKLSAPNSSTSLTPPVAFSSLSQSESRASSSAGTAAFLSTPVLSQSGKLSGSSSPVSPGLRVGRENARAGGISGSISGSTGRLVSGAVACLISRVPQLSQ